MGELSVFGLVVVGLLGLQCSLEVNLHLRVIVVLHQRLSLIVTELTNVVVKNLVFTIKPLASRPLPGIELRPCIHPLPLLIEVLRQQNLMIIPG